MFTCALHNWFSDSHPCPACPTITTSSTELIINPSTDPETLTNTVDEASLRKIGDELLTELKKDPNHITTQLNRDEQISYNTGFHKGFAEGVKYRAGASTSQHGGDFLKVLEENLQAMRDGLAAKDWDGHPTEQAYLSVIETYEDMIAIFKNGSWRSQSTPTPPGIVDQLRNRMPMYNRYSDKDTWNECCDTLATLHDNELDRMGKLCMEKDGEIEGRDNEILKLSKGFDKIIDIVKRYRAYDGETSIGNHIENECKEILATLLSEDKGEEKEEAK
jgi:hypothetical protein